MSNIRKKRTKGTKERQKTKITNECNWNYTSITQIKAKPQILTLSSKKCKYDKVMSLLTVVPRYINIIIPR